MFRLEGVFMSEFGAQDQQGRQGRLAAALKAAERAKKSNEERSRSEMTYMLNYGASAPVTK